MFKMRGGSKVKEIPEEDAIRDFAFATIVATRDLKVGEIITKDNTWPKRPGIGQILAREHEQIIGRRIKKNVKKDNHISYQDFY